MKKKILTHRAENATYFCVSERFYPPHVEVIEVKAGHDIYTYSLSGPGDVTSLRLWRKRNKTYLAKM